jgi:hypothetical protein
MTALPNTSPYLEGKHKLPAGAVPLCTDKPGSVICQTAHGYWIRWWEETRSIERTHQSIQRHVVAALVARAGGTQALADRIKVSPRTVQAWRGSRIPIPLKAADDIAHLLLKGEPA